MTKQKFMLFWNEWSSRWIDSAKCCHVDDLLNSFPVKDKCEIKKDITDELYSLYSSCKEEAKERYFFHSEKVPILSRYKRAALIAYVVLLANCLDYKDNDKFSTDPYLLKERLAFHMALGSIIQSFKQDQVENLIASNNRPLFFFDSLGIDRGKYDDTFLQSVYKDMYFSRVYQNYNILTMANVFGLLTEKASLLGEIIEPAKNE